MRSQYLRRSKQSLLVYQTLKYSKVSRRKDTEQHAATVADQFRAEYQAGRPGSVLSKAQRGEANLRAVKGSARIRPYTPLGDVSRPVASVSDVLLGSLQQNRSNLCSKRFLAVTSEDYP